MRARTAVSPTGNTGRNTDLNSGQDTGRGVGTAGTTEKGAFGRPVGSVRGAGKTSAPSAGESGHHKALPDNSLPTKSLYTTSLSTTRLHRFWCSLWFRG